jgi:hypothetical protein
MQIKQPRFDSINADFSVANVLLNLLRTKSVHEASVLRFGSAGALGACRVEEYGRANNSSKKRRDRVRDLAG